jgi:hypothetical protein
MCQCCCVVHKFPNEFSAGFVGTLCVLLVIFHVKLSPFCSASKKPIKIIDGRQNSSVFAFQEKTCYQRVLNTWYGCSKQVWRLVYRASTHGYSAESFHRHCDGVAPTYVIAMVGVLGYLLTLLELCRLYGIIIY